MADYWPYICTGPASVMTIQQFPLLAKLYEDDLYRTNE